MDKKKLAAAMAAVTMYIKTQEEAAAAMAEAAAQGAQAPSTAGPSPMANAWGITGRQSQMNANTMMQMRMFK